VSAPDPNRMERIAWGLTPLLLAATASFALRVPRPRAQPFAGPLLPTLCAES
jgi:hypothetical protein